MKKKKIIFILLICLIALISVSAISAADDASSDIISTDDASSDIISEDIDEDIILEENNNILEVGSEEQISINEENSENAEKTVLTESDIENFTELNNLINSNDDDVIYLENDYYYYSLFGESGFEEGIVINRTVTIEGNNHTIDACYDGRAFKIIGENVIIKNINFIRGGNYNGGGAILWEGGQGTLINCTFSDNRATGYNGGAIRWSGTQGTLANCTFSGNKANANYNSGGAISWEGSQGTLANCTFTDNAAYEYGGAIYWSGEDGKLENNIFTDNYVLLYGGAIYWSGEDGKLKNNTFQDNDAQFGGAIYWSSTNGILTNNTFQDNDADHYGGAIYSSATNGIIENNTFINNTADMDGAAYFNNLEESSNTKINHNIFLDNGGFQMYYQIYNQIGHVIYFTHPEGSDANYNWFGNNVTNYNELPGIQEETFTTWLFLNTSDIPESMTILSSAEITFKLLAYSTESGISEYDYNLLPKVNLTISATNGNITSYSVQIGDKVTYTATELGIGNITATIGGTTQTIEITIIKIDPKMTVTAEEINSLENPIIYLSYNSAATGTVNITFEGKNGDNQQCDDIPISSTITVPFTLQPGEYNIIINYSGDDYFMQSSVNTSFVVKKIPELNIDPYNISVKDENGKMFNITMPGDATGNITLSLNNVSLGTMDVREFFVNYEGQYITNLRNDNKSPGLYTLTVTYSGDAVYENSTVSASSTIKKFTPEINIGISDINYGEDAKIKVTVDATGKVTLTVDGKTYTEELKDKTATFSISKLSVGVKNVTVNYNGDVNNYGSQKDTSFTVNKLGTKITASAVSTTYNVDKKFVITLKDSKGKVLSGVKVTVTLGSSKKYTTDKNGQIKISIGSLVPKTYTAKISFAGNANYKASSASAKVTVQKATPKMTAKAKTFKIKDKTKKYTITLKNNKGKVMKSTKVSLKVNGKTYSVKTNSKGIATFKLTKLTKKGKFSAVITYSGDKYYKKLTKKVTMTVKA